MFQPHNTNLESIDADRTPPGQGSLIICSQLHLQELSAPVAHNRRRVDWSSINDILVILWPGMAIEELKKTLEVVYGFSATTNQYEERFRAMKSVSNEKEGKKSRDPLQCRGKERSSAKSDIERECQLFTARKIKEERSEMNCSAATLKSLGTDSALTENEEHFGYFDSHGLSLQSQFLDLLGHLWDSTVDLVSPKDRDVDLYHAVNAMVKFLTSVHTPQSNCAVAMAYPDDLLMVQIISKMLSSECPDLARELQASLEQHPSWSLPRASLRLRGILSYVGAPENHLDELCQGGVVPLINCCQCGAGPYLRALYVGCVMDNCADHKFCERCNDSQ